MITLVDFDTHLDNYLKATRKEINMQIFYLQFKMLFNGNSADFIKTYNEFKKNSRHVKQLILL
jgi:hypothetical protein